MHFTSEQRLDGNLVQRHFTLGEIPGILWTTRPAPLPVPLIMLGHPGRLDDMYPRLLGRVRQATSHGFAAAAIEVPGSGDRPRIPALDDARAELRRAIHSGETAGPDLIDRLVLPLVETAVPELQAALDALLVVPGIRGPVGFSGGIISIGVRLAVVEPRIKAAGLFAGSFIPRQIRAEARDVVIPVHVLLQWDDEFNDRQAALELFDAFGSQQKSLSANMGGHVGVPEYAADEATRFFARHLT